MNTDYSENVKKLRDQIPTNELLRIPQFSYHEARLGLGRMFFPIVYFLCFSNCMIYAAKNNLGQNKKFFIACVLFSMPISSIASKYLFGYYKYRELAKRQIHDLKSANLYEKRVYRQA